MKPQNGLQIIYLPILLGLYLWLSTAPATETSIPGLRNSSEIAAPSVSRRMETNVGPEALLVGIFCSIGIHFTLRFQKSLQEHARSR